MAKVSSLQIGELAKQAGVSIRTVRYYEELGLLSPSNRTSGGMRLYNETDVTRLRFIHQLRTLRLSLDEIKLALDLEQPPRNRQERVDHTLRVLLMEQTRAEETMTALKQLKDEVGSAIANVTNCTTCPIKKCPEGCHSLAYLL